MRCSLVTLSAAALLAPTTVTAQRTVHALNGPWEVRAQTPEPGAWRPIEVPSTFETALGTDFDGVAEYRRTLRVAELFDLQAGDRVVLRFAAVATHATVYIDGVEIGQHLGGWTPFRCVIPARLFDKKQWTIRVRVDERVGHNTQGFLPIIAPHFGGIWQGVQITRHRGMTLSPDELVVRGTWRDGRARLRVEAGRDLGGAQLHCWLQGKRQRRLPLSLELPRDVRPWSPQDPRRYQLRIELIDGGGRVLDQVHRHVVFTDVQAEGRAIHVNGQPFRVRGVLHWGYEPPSLAPHRDVERWKRQLRYLKSSGFNLVKACLWFPPPAFFAAAETVGMFVWQEYPTWHPDMSKKHLGDLVTEYDEFFHIDKQRGVILARSLTCETGRAAADAEVIEKLFRRCKSVTGAALVEDDSSWIAWNRFHDFYDDHPYGNCGPWLGRLRGFDAYIRKHGAKPFLLGEAIAADTWLTADAFADARLQESWWRPAAFDQQRAFAAQVARELGAGAAAALVPDSLRFGMLARKYQIETYCRVFPHAGYVVSVVRDFRKARMGLFDDLSRPKWSTAEFAWHGAGMLSLRDPRAIRSVERSFHARPPRVFGDSKIGWKVAEAVFRHGRWVTEASQDGDAVTRQQLTARKGSSIGDQVKQNSWTFYRLPPVELAPLPEGVRIATRLDPTSLQWVEDGGRLLLTPGGKGALRSQQLWFLRGAPYGPTEHPLLQSVPRDLLVDLLQFDFDAPVFVDTPLITAMDQVLGFWDTHDRHEEVGTFTLLAEARVGKGRLAVCALNLDPKPERPFDAPDGATPEVPNPARAWLRSALVRHLAEGPASRKTLTPEFVANLSRRLAAESQPLDGMWRLRADKDDVGTEAGWAAAKLDDSAWLESRAGIHWEHAGLPHYTGIAWYRKHFDAPRFWQEGEPLYAVFDGVDDSYVLFVNGKQVASFGDPKTGETVWLIRTHADISPFLRLGKNVLTLRVVDHQGAGGLHRGVRLSTADPQLEDIIQR